MLAAALHPSRPNFSLSFLKAVFFLAVGLDGPTAKLGAEYVKGEQKGCMEEGASFGSRKKKVVAGEEGSLRTSLPPAGWCWGLCSALVEMELD